jgi:hypothetical protein
MDDELISQFLAFTGRADTSKAASYLEMCGGNVETAVGMFLEHQGGGGGGASGMPENQVRAPDATRTMRLMDDGPFMGGVGGVGVGGMMGNPYIPMVDPMVEEQLRTTAFAAHDVRDTINAAANNDMAMDDDDDNDGDDDDYEYNDDGEEEKESRPKIQAPSLSDMFAAPEHLIFNDGGFEGARNMAKDNKRWLLVNLQKNSEFSSHALNRDVWRDELVENLIREGFIFWQAVSTF